MVAVMTAPHPHCNTEVLHAPGECEFCDKYPERQQGRIVSKTPFSPVDQAWPGNRPEGYRDFNYLPSLAPRDWPRTRSVLRRLFRRG